MRYRASKIVSFIKAGYIQSVRLSDHIYRLLTGRPTVLHSQISPNLFLGGQYGPRGLVLLKRWEVTAVVSMRMAPPPAFTRVSWLTLLHLPTPDQTAPTLHDLNVGVKFIESEINRGGKVYIHCFWGEGRGPSMAIAYLISQGLTLKDAFNEVLRVRTFIKPNLVQLKQLKLFESMVNQT